MKDNCCICNKEIDDEASSILTVGVFGTPKYLCKECEEKIDIAQTDKDPEKIGAAMQNIGEMMANNDKVGKIVFTAVGEIFDAARKRAEQIKEGSYDFSLDTPVEVIEKAEEIPDELLESDEDRELDKKDEEREKKTNKVIDIITAVLFSAIAVYFIYKIFDMFL
jgi:hypothetical protein